MAIYAKMGQFQKVEELMKQMKQENIPRNLIIYSNLLQAYGNAKEFEKGMECWTNLKIRFKYLSFFFCFSHGDN